MPGVMIAVAHLTIAAVWMGSMTYSLFVVQPKADRFFTDESRREEFLVALAHGNRWRVVAMIGVLVLSAVAVMATWPEVIAGYAVAIGLYVAATCVFAQVSWRHWPARVFALPEELAGFRRRLRIQAWTMLGLVGTAFVVALSVSVAARP